MARFLCVFCGTEHGSYSGTGSDVLCCGELGHVEEVCQHEWVRDGYQGPIGWQACETCAKCGATRE